MRAPGLRWLGVALGLLGSACGRGGDVDRVVLVTIDTLRADRVGAYGDAGAHTPHLDELARAGVRFEAAFSPAPLTLPSHASLMTGLEPPRHGVRHNTFFALEDGIPTLATRMRETGFGTAAFVGAFVLDARFGLASGFDVYDDTLAGRIASRSNFSFTERTADAVVDAALAWLATAPERFFLWVHLYDPHADYRPPERFAQVDGGDAYAGEVAFADEQVGRLLEAVKGPGVLVAVTSDHGESLGEHREMTHSYGIYDATQRIPLILAGSGLPRDSVVSAPVSLVDLAPTLLALAGATPLADADGRSLLPLLRGEQEPERPVYLETLATQLEMEWSPLLGLRTARHKYVRAPRRELYDVVADPAETRNLAASQPETVAALDQVLAERLVGARPVVPNLELDAADRARLESLGYVVVEPRQAGSGRPPGVVGGADPKDHMDDVVRMHQAMTLAQAGRLREALELAERISSQGPMALRYRASIALAAQRPDVAARDMELAVARGNDAPADRALLGLAYIELDRPEDARRELELAQVRNPGAPAALLGLGQLAEAEGDPDLAEALYAEADRVDPANGVARIRLLRLLLAQGRSDEAEALLEGLEPGFATRPDVAIQIAQAEQRAGRPERALEFLDRALREQPRDPLLLRNHAFALQQLGRPEAALRSLKRRHALDPADPSSKNDLAWGLVLAERNLDRALALARKAAAQLEGDPAVLDTLATVHLVRGEPRAALAVAEQALALEPGDDLRPHLLYVRAAALSELERPDEARAALRALGGEPVALEPPWQERATDLARRLGMEADGESG